jgi:hypothetical protein
VEVLESGDRRYVTGGWVRADASANHPLGVTLPARQCGTIGTRMLNATLQRVALVLIGLPVTCMSLCTFRVEPVHDWMMRHHCPFAMLTMHRPSHPIGIPLRAHSTMQR